MHLSRAVIKRAQAPHEVLDYNPRQIDRADHSVVDNIVNTGRESRFLDFKVAEVIRDFTGLAEVQSAELEKAIEDRTLEKLKEIEESAYSEAYKLGLDEGRKEAFKAAADEINKRLAGLDQLLDTILNMKPQLISANEAHLVELSYYLSTRLAMFEIQKNEQATLHVMKEAIKMAQGDEKIKVLVSDSELEFLETLQRETSRDLEFLKKVELKGQPDIQPGGCILVTNYGEVDAKIEARVEQLWNAIKDTIPQSKDIVGPE